MDLMMNGARHPFEPSMHPAVLQRMRQIAPFICNPQSLHRHGSYVRKCLHDSSEKLLQILGRPTKEQVIWTSSASEALALVLWGYARLFPEHSIYYNKKCSPAVLGIAEELRQAGYRCQPLPLQSFSELAPCQISLLVDSPFCPLTGVLEEDPLFNAWAATTGLPRLLDASWLAIASADPLLFTGYSFLVLKASGWGGPQALGALVLPKAQQLPALWGGGQQYKGMRPGTPASLAIIGFYGALASLSSQPAMMPEAERYPTWWQQQFTALAAGIDVWPEVTASNAASARLALWGSETLISSYHRYFRGQKALQDDEGKRALRLLQGFIAGHEMAWQPYVEAELLKKHPQEKTYLTTMVLPSSKKTAQALLRSWQVLSACVQGVV